VEYASEELNQLMKMYNEDELTEESEKIVLRRAQRDLESSKRYQDKAKLSAERQINVNFPREDIRQDDELKRQALKYEKTKATLPYRTDRAEIALKKAQFAYDQAKKKSDELAADHKYMTLTAPIDGIVYHGRCVRGKWSGVGSSGGRELEVETKVPPKKVVMTVFDPAQLVIRSEIPEDKLRFLDEKTTGTAILKSDDSVRLPVKVKGLKRVPLSSGNFDCMFEFDNVDNSKRLMLPAMNCSVSVNVYENPNAIVVPKASVFTDDGFNHYVFMTDSKRKNVEVGHIYGDSLEIRSGLSANDKIRKSRP
jgi:multidrug efflux pump subunit AcrA (membrane-fusion protein)